jgi:hypothetical protein
MEIGVYPALLEAVLSNITEIRLTAYNLRRFCTENNKPLFILDTEINHGPVRKLFTFYECAELTAIETRIEA